MNSMIKNNTKELVLSTIHSDIKSSSITDDALIKSEKYVKLSDNEIEKYMEYANNNVKKTNIIFVEKSDLDEYEWTIVEDDPVKIDSFGVYDKLKVVLSYTGCAFMFGYMTGINMLVSTLKNYPILSSGLLVAATYGASISPEIALSTAKYVIVGGFVTGSVVAAPILIIGSAGVFVSAAGYHAFIKASKMIEHRSRF